MQTVDQNNGKQLSEETLKKVRFNDDAEEKK